ncbi:hypothetical protein [Amycolatopsis azurea]|uniref:Pre-toxin TG domain-containing protein n=1 Tax=Amycolatopsis azurea DSM 43854 TaxID=1238180 RepID=A0ABX3JJU5_9PSEU|nr:hypothetical protein [Amycolatopsis azurea]OOC08026.1 hypothetical protein B0293_03830 [Amycolatopsis azurea DSM 43854]
MWKQLYTSKREKAVAKFAKLPPAELEKRKTEMLETIKTVKDPLNMKNLQAMQLAADIHELGNYEFIYLSPSGNGLLVQGKLLERTAATLRDKVVTKLFTADQNLRGAQTPEQLIPALATADSAIKASGDMIEELAKTLAKLQTYAPQLLETKAAKAWANQNPSKATKAIEVILKIGNGTLALGTEFIPPGYRTLGAMAEAGKAGFDRVVQEFRLARDAKEFQDENLKGAAFDKLTEDPAAMAKYVADQCGKNFDLLLAVAGIACVEVPGWGEVVSPAIAGAGHAYFQERVSLLEASLKKAAGATAKTSKEKVLEKTKEAIKATVKEIKDKLKDHLLEAVGSAGLTALQLGRSKTMAVESISRFVVKQIVKYLPIDPAQPISGDQLKADIQEITNNSTLTLYHKKGQAEAPIDYPSETADGVKVTMIMDPVPRKDGARTFVWAKAEGLQGRLYLDDKSFVAELPDPEISQLPDAVKDGRPIDMIRSGKENGQYVARVEGIWGLVDPKTKAWAYGQDLTANVKGSVAYNITALLSGKVPQSYQGRL